MRNIANSVIVVTLLAATAWLTYEGRDITPLVVLATAILGGSIHSKMSQVQSLVNGNITQLHQLISDLTNKLANSVPAETHQAVVVSELETSQTSTETSVQDA